MACLVLRRSGKIPAWKARLLAAKDVLVFDPRPDGSCQMSCFKYVMTAKEPTKDDTMTLRNQLIAEIRNSSELRTRFEPALEQDANIDAWCDRMDTTTEYGDESTLITFVYLFRIKVVVVDLSSSSGAVVEYSPSGSCVPKAVKDHMVLKRENLHYTVVNAERIWDDICNCLEKKEGVVMDGNNSNSESSALPQSAPAQATVKPQDMHGQASVPNAQQQTSRLGGDLKSGKQQSADARLLAERDAQLRDSEDRNRHLQEEIRKLRDEQAKRHPSSNKEEDRNRHLQEEVNQLQQELSKTRAELKQKDEQLRDERAKRHPSSNKEEEESISSMKIRLDEAEARNRDLRQGNDDLQDEVKRLQKDLTEKDASLTRLEAQLALSQSHKAASSANVESIKEKDDQISDQQKRLEEKDGELKDLKEKLSEATEAAKHQKELMNMMKKTASEGRLLDLKALTIAVWMSTAANSTCAAPRIAAVAAMMSGACRIWNRGWQRQPQQQRAQQQQQQAQQPQQQQQQQPQQARQPQQQQQQQQQQQRQQQARQRQEQRQQPSRKQSRSRSRSRNRNKQQRKQQQQPEPQLQREPLRRQQQQQQSQRQQPEAGPQLRQQQQQQSPRQQPEAGQQIQQRLGPQLRQQPGQELERNPRQQQPQQQPRDMGGQGHSHGTTVA